MSDQLLKFNCIVRIVYTFLKYSSISGAILKIDFLSSKRIMKISQKKIDLTYLTGHFYCHFLHTRGVSIHEIKELFPLKPSLVSKRELLNLTILICEMRQLSMFT